MQTHRWHSLDGCLMQTIDVQAEHKQRKSRITDILLKATLSRFFGRRVLGNSAVSILAITALAASTQAYV